MEKEKTCVYKLFFIISKHTATLGLQLVELN